MNICPNYLLVGTLDTIVLLINVMYYLWKYSLGMRVIGYSVILTVALNNPPSTWELSLVMARSI